MTYTYVCVCVYLYICFAIYVVYTYIDIYLFVAYCVQVIQGLILTVKSPLMGELWYVRRKLTFNISKVHHCIINSI